MTFKRSKYGTRADVFGLESYVTGSWPMYTVELRTPRRFYLFGCTVFIWCKGHRNPLRYLTFKRPHERDRLKLWEAVPPSAYLN